MNKIKLIIGLVAIIALAYYCSESPARYVGLIQDEFKGEIVVKRFDEIWHYTLSDNESEHDFVPTCGPELQIGDLIYKPANANFFYVYTGSDTVKVPFIRISESQYGGVLWPDGLEIDYIDCKKTEPK
ncbi:hypothetical protein [Cesiribacter sp. SM1]|uniref:hypothetical protein n=1 Tax=Cesiribacter sp. SM1 TaxID=2861196 RepID=UPI001CD66294|nr:hypothetical protein [Cesiribacter sp. SM1]